ncbi:hypothetical protein TRFO_26931 [Tritrichomonas foetus]|uniref:Uncharacterized protein n=1 Tax=Tritrichomonas foetus TaxID=1144522 RepID=A0A1J4K3A5_9EUKA|nr:hypothetical protein TRFO_26931 [Tritrichomonas foetus]|eukprot:OHT05312.1 hypothetical protein TRFO_26931 [Tritrichomonas foetus]
MISPIRSLCFNDDRQTFTIVLPSQYRIFRCDPFGMIFSRECEDLSLGAVATYSGYRFIALAGAPSPKVFNSKSVRVFDHQTGQLTFEHDFSDHILSMGIGKDIIVVCMYTKTEVWNTRTGQMMYNLGCGKNVHVPMAISPNSTNLILSGPTDKQVALHRGIGGQIQSSNFVVDEAAVSLVKFSDDGTLFATAGFSGNCIRIWELKTLSTCAILDRGSKEDIIMAIDFSPSSDFVASVSKSGVIRVYDIRRRAPNATRATQPVCTENLGQPVYMPRFSWINSMLIGLASLEGDYYKITFNGSSLECEKTPFLKRVV